MLTSDCSYCKHNQVIVYMSPSTYNAKGIYSGCILNSSVKTCSLQSADTCGRTLHEKKRRVSAYTDHRKLRVSHNN
jgi:hypothetical protein